MIGGDHRLRRSRSGGRMTVRSVTCRSLVVGLLASLCVVGSGPRASAEPTWLQTVDVGLGSGQPERYDVDHLPDGHRRGGLEREDRGGRWQGQLRDPSTRGRRASRPAKELSEPGAFDPQLVVDDQGAITVAWLTSANTVQATRLEPGAAQWTTPETRHPSRRPGVRPRRGVERRGHGCLAARGVRPRRGRHGATAWTPARSRQVGPGRLHRSSPPIPGGHLSNWRP